MNKKNPGFFMKKLFLSFICFFSLIACFDCFSQEALKSAEEEYYDYLSLFGILKRPFLNYRTLSDSDWSLDENAEHIWKGNNLGTKKTLWSLQNKKSNWFTDGLDTDIKLKLYGPDWLNSYNTAAPYGQNDGALWQGKGYNTSLSAGARLEAFGFELTIKPQVTFSQNLEFAIMPSDYDSEYGYFWSYDKNRGIDAPQRFGNKAFWTFDWGDTETRWSWHTFTAGFGTQTIWLGPAYLNPILHSNNAATYPKFDLGIRKTELVIPNTDFSLGTIGGRVWVGYLSESDYFDNDEANNHNQISGFAFSYNPPFIKGFTIGINKICLTKWGNNFWKYLNPFYNDNKDEDQKMSFTMDWTSEQGGLEFYTEIAIDDKPNYSNSIDSYITHFWHAMAWTFGAKKTVNFSSNFKGIFTFEWNNTEMSQDFQVNWPYSFGFHHQITQGFTNRGQYIGSGIGYGGNNQYLGFKLYYPKGYSEIFILRNNPDNNYLFKESIYDVSTGEDGELHKRTWNYFKANFVVSISSAYYITPDFIVSGEFAYDRIVNPLYNYGNIYDVWNNFHIMLKLKYNL